MLMAAQGKPDFDLGLFTEFEAIKASRAGYLAEYAKGEIASLADFPDEKLPTSPQGSVIDVPVMKMILGIMFGRDQAEAEDFRSWDALISPAMKGKISIQRPVYLSSYELPMMTAIKGGQPGTIDAGLPYLQAMIANSANIYPTVAVLTNMVAQGEIVAAVSYSMQKRVGAEPNSIIDFVVPEEGGLELDYVMVRPKNAAGNSAVDAFMNYLGSAEAQRRAAELTILPANPTVQFPDSLEKLWGMNAEQLRSKLISVNWHLVADNHDEWARLIEKMIADAGVK